MMTPMRTLVVVPTYNERDTILEAAERLFKASPEADLLVVDDGSPDGTAELVRDLSTRDERVHLLERTRKEGLGRAYMAGFAWALDAGYDAIVEMDADLSHDPAAVPRLVEALKDGADLAVGSRYVPGGRIENWGSVRRALSRFGNIYARLLLRFDVRDSTSGFRAFRADKLGEEPLDDVASHGYAFQIEMTRRIHLKGGHIVEVPITFVERVAGNSKMSRKIVLEALWEVTAWGVGDRLKKLRRRPV